VLKPRDAVAEMADLMGMSHRANQYLTRLLREAGGDLWPAIGTGRRGGVTLEHLINNLIANYCAPGQPSDGPRAVRDFHLLRPWSTRSRVRTPSPNALIPADFWKESFEQPFEGETLFDFLCQQVAREVLIDRVQRVDDLSPLIHIFLRSQGRPMEARVIWYTLGDPDQGQTIRTYRIDPEMLSDLDIKTNVRPKPALLQVAIGAAEFAAIATVAAKVEEFDTLEINPRAPSGRGVAGDAGPETTKAAGPGSHDSLQSEQPAPVSSRSPRRAPNRPLDKDESNAPPGRRQSASRLAAYGLQAGYQPVTARSRRHGASRTDAASPQAG
jgi:hypothetical protein